MTKCHGVRLRTCKYVQTWIVGIYVCVCVHVLELMEFSIEFVYKRRVHTILNIFIYKTLYRHVPGKRT